MSFKVTATKKGVKFSIDHQSFKLHIDPDPEQKSQFPRHQWYARMLRIALHRLEKGE